MTREFFAHDNNLCRSHIMLYYDFNSLQWVTRFVKSSYRIVISGLTRKRGERVNFALYWPRLCASLNKRIFDSGLNSNNSYYYMASSASGQDDPNRALWLATRAGKMEPSCPLGTTRCVPQAKLPRKPYNKYFIDQVCSVKMAGYLANIQPSWPHTWSTTHTYDLSCLVTGFSDYLEA